MLRVRGSLGAEVSHIQTRTPAEFDENFRHYATEGFALVFGHGFEYEDAVRQVAPKFPRTMFVVTSGAIAGPNYAGMRCAFHQPSYLAGVIAGQSLAPTSWGRSAGPSVLQSRDMG